MSKLKDPTGAPDRIFWFPKTPELVEFKDPNGDGTTELQAKYQKIFKQLGYHISVVETKEQFLELARRRGIKI